MATVKPVMTSPDSHRMSVCIICQSGSTRAKPFVRTIVGQPGGNREERVDPVLGHGGIGCGVREGGDRVFRLVYLQSPVDLGGLRARDYKHVNWPRAIHQCR